MSHLLIYLAAFTSAFVVAFILFPVEIITFGDVIRKEKGRRKGILLLLTPFINKASELVKDINFPYKKVYLSWVTKKLQSAALERLLSAEDFTGLQIISPLPVIPVILLAIFRIPAFKPLCNVLGIPLSIIGVIVLFFLLAVMILTDKVAKRHKSISRELPFALDMLTSAVGAGLDFSGAIRRFIEKAAKSSPLKDELSQMLKEINLGKTRSQALTNMAVRVNLPELTSVTNSLIQADQLGTGVGQALTMLSDDLRVKRFQKAEKMALEAPVKMLFPLVGFIFPAVFIILIGPLILQIMQAR